MGPRAIAQGEWPQEGARGSREFTSITTLPNLLSLGNSDSNGYYLQRCTEQKIMPHPTRFPVALPECFLRFLTVGGDTVLDPFPGSCTTGEAAEPLHRNRMGLELRADHLDGTQFRFEKGGLPPAESQSTVAVPTGVVLREEMALF